MLVFRLLSLRVMQLSGAKRTTENLRKGKARPYMLIFRLLSLRVIQLSGAR